MSYYRSYSSGSSTFRRPRSGSFGSTSFRYGGGGIGGYYRSRTTYSWSSSIHSYRPRYTSGRHRPVYDRHLWHGKNNPSLITDQNNIDADTKGDEPVKKAADIDLCKTANRTAHHTDCYETEQLVVRRGQPFDVTVTLSKNFDKENDKVKLQFTIGETPQQSKGTLVRVKTMEKEDQLTTDDWGCVVVSTNGTDQGTTLKLKVMPCVEAPVGEWTVFVETLHKREAEEPEIHRYKQEETFYLIFNPWCKDDTVYMENEEERKEYVLNESGRVYVGTKESIHGKPWNFGQFEKTSLEAAVYLLHNSYLATEGVGNVVQVTRALTAMANSNDQDNGVLSGNWSGNYSGGVCPTTWNGSVAILEQYMLTKRDVKFGQCWVFSALLTTLCRALGIPSRSVTNFKSAHDTDYSMTIDTHVDSQGRPLHQMNDSIWNFHVWNEGWFRRRDLPDGNDGWQAFDATPQEASEGMMRCGPAPVVAIKKGDVYFGYDTKFIFAEVNGDAITWEVGMTGEDMLPLEILSGTVGHFISTKAVGKPERHDVTENYKFPDGSEEERKVVAKASKYSSRKDKLKALYNMRKNNDVELKFNGKMAPNGQLTLTMSGQNKTKEPRHIDVNIYAMAKYYTGAPGDDIDQKEMKIALGPEEAKDDTWCLDPVIYLNRLDADAQLGVHVMAKVKSTGQTFVHQEQFEVEKPNLELKASTDQVKVGESFTVKVTFTNPLALTLTNCELHIEGPGIQRNLKIPLHRSIPAGKTDSEVITMVPRLPGKREVIANLHAKQLTGMDGVTEIEVLKK